MKRQIFVNLPVTNLEKSMEFFKKLGFSFNSEFTDENGACMIIGENIYSMLLKKKFFKSFLRKTEVGNAKKETEVLIAITVNSRKEVDKMFEKAIKAGAKEAREAEDYGWMYTRAFHDLDGHIWEIFYGDDEARKKQG